ncbi:ABC transporter ATP-binding protein [Luteococcus sediminum]
MIQTQHLTKRYGASTVVDDLSLEVRPGIVTGFLGPNGAGKSTTMRMILGLEDPTSGTATIGGQPYRRIARPLLTVGAMLDASWVNPKRSGRDHLRWMAASNGIASGRVDEVLDDVGLSEAGGKAAGSYSLGMRQRLGLAGAMLGRPEYYVFDEPVNGLDPEGIVWIRQIMRRLASEGNTVLVSSHLLSEMALTADHLLVIARGRLVADMSVPDFIAEHSGGSIRVRTKDLDGLARVLRLQGGIVEVVPPDTTVDFGSAGPRLQVTGLTAEEVGDAAAQARIAVHELSTEHASLEEAFMTMTHDGVDHRASAGARREELAVA